MKKTVLITGTSSGIGLAAAKQFAQQGWQVLATQRNPEADTALAQIPNIQVCKMDVMDPSSIEAVFQKIKTEFGTLDVVVNNAGYGVDGVFEAMSDSVIEKQFNTNVFGLMRVTREAIRLMRPQGGGTIIQVSSMGGKITFPLYSIYHATKFAVEGFTESVHYELLPFKIRMKLIEPGLIATEFTGRNREFIKPNNLDAYDDYLAKFGKAAVKAMKGAEKPEVVAAEIFKAATDSSSKMRYPIGAPAPMILRLRKLLSDNMLFSMIRKTYKL